MGIGILTQLELWFFTRLYLAVPELVLRHHEREWWKRHIRKLEDALIEEQGRSAGNLEAMGIMTDRYEARIRLMHREHTAELKRVMRLAMTDPLTGLANRRAFGESFNRLFAVSHPPEGVAERRQPVGVISYLIIDIDHFKQVNDRYGHSAGDAVLMQMASLLREHLGHRSSDIIALLNDDESIARFGGEEFIVSLPQANTDAAFKLASAFRLGVEKHLFHVMNNHGQTVELRLTVSCGVSTITVEEGMFPNAARDRLQELADRALYLAKESGRNRVMRFDQLPQE